MKASSEVLFPAERIAARVAELGAQITADFADTEVAVLGILKGSFIFMADLVRRIERPVRCGFMDMSASRRSEKITELMFTSSFDIDGAHLLLVDDVMETGITQAYLKQQLELQGPRSIRVVTLLDKQIKRKVDIQSDYVAFEAPDRLIVGYGLGHGERFRNLPYLTYVE